MDALATEVPLASSRVFHAGRHALLRALLPSDVHALYPQAAVQQVLATYKPGLATDAAGIHSAARRLEWLAALAPPPEVEGLIVHRASGTPIGFITLGCIDPANAKAEMSLALFRGRGTQAAAEAVLWTLEHAFGEMAVRKLLFHVLAQNSHALRVALAAGLTHEALLREEVADADGARCDLHRFCLFARDWHASALRRRLRRIEARAG